jgi:pyruvate kinase
MMKKIILQAESSIEYLHEDFEHKNFTESDLDKKHLIKSAVHIAEQHNVAAIVLFTKTGKLARIAAAYRPKTPIFAFTNRRETITQTAILFGVVSRHLPFISHTDVLKEALQILINKNDITKSDRIIVITDIKHGEIYIPTMEIISLKSLFA